MVYSFNISLKTYRTTLCFNQILNLLGVCMPTQCTDEDIALIINFGNFRSDKI